MLDRNHKKGLQFSQSYTCRHLLAATRRLFLLRQLKARNRYHRSNRPSCRRKRQLTPMTNLAEIINKNQPETYTILVAFAGRLSDRWLQGAKVIPFDQRQSEEVKGRLAASL